MPLQTLGEEEIKTRSLSLAVKHPAYTPASSPRESVIGSNPIGTTNYRDIESSIIVSLVVGM